MDLWRFELRPERRHLRVEGPTFRAGVVLDKHDAIIDAAPLIGQYRIGFTLAHLQESAAFHGWRLYETTPDDVVEIRADSDPEQARAALLALRPGAVIISQEIRLTPYNRPALSVVKPAQVAHEEADPERRKESA